MKRIIWNEEQKAIIIELYADTLTSDIAAKVSHSLTSTYRMAYDLGLKKSDDFKNSIKSGRILKLSTTGASKRFTKGHESWNKGKKIEEYATEKHIQKFRGTQFPKGHKPANYRPIGSTRIDKDGYLQIKVSDGFRPWRHLHRVNYEAKNGPVPKDMNVMFRDGNRLNCDPSNLILRTKAECMMLNTIQHYDKQLQQSIKLLKKIEKLIINS